METPPKNYCKEDDYIFKETEDVLEDLVISTGPIGLQQFNIQITATSPFVKIRDGAGKEAIISESWFLWLLSTGDANLSSERLQTVKAVYS